MKPMRWHIGWMIICCLGLVACSEQKEADKTEAAPVEQESPSEEMVPVAARTVEGMVEQPAGKLIEEYMEPKIEAARTVDFVTYLRFYEDEFADIMKEELPAYFKEYPDLRADEIYDYLVSQLGSGQYKRLYEQLASYEHGYVMPELPEGKDEIEIAKRQKTNIVILMDASGSMKGEVDGRMKMDLAKEAIENFTSQLDDEVNVALFAYGHKGAGTKADKGLSCGAIDELYPLSSYDKISFHDAMESFSASGWTPLAGAIEKANDYLASFDKEQYRNIVYIVSDGIETCDGDPVQAAKQMNDSEIEAKVNIIGFDVDDEGQAQLKQVAEAGGGQYATVRNQSEFEGVLIKKMEAEQDASPHSARCETA
ncbi:VWA domain-containing protein [Sporosarcina sp. Te-1]|uniref:vWA domain-containing protein n=1 Tax=Sporosarcina sp. Te-1 TaxID=2818390 RepID=UPI001A9D8932|nr:VWA domain-containing protein [Sporosarcina sp. Te-1]QTD39913.1 VWA domain-containing protein [Sporosarcina sp. Te-1]